MRRWARASAMNAPHSAAIAGTSQIHDARRRLLRPASNSPRLPDTARAAKSRPARVRMIQIQRCRLAITTRIRVTQGGEKWARARVAISRPGVRLGGQFRQRNAHNDHAVLGAGRRPRRDPVDQPADREVVRLHDPDRRADGLLGEQPQDRPGEQAAYPTALPGVFDPDGEFGDAGRDRRGRGEPEHLAVALYMTGVAGCHGQLLPAHDLVQVELREHRKGMVKAVTPGLWAASREQVEQGLPVLGLYLGGDYARPAIWPGRSAAGRHLEGQRQLVRRQGLGHGALLRVLASVIVEPATAAPPVQWGGLELRARV